MTLSPTPRLLVLLGLGLPAAIAVGILAPAAWPWVPLAMVVVCVAALFDGVLAPLGQGLEVKLGLPRSLGIGRNADAGIEVKFRGRVPGRIELRLGLNRVLLSPAAEIEGLSVDSGLQGLLERIEIPR